MRFVLAFLVLLSALPLAAADYEQLLLPIAPSVVHCAHHSRFETRLLAFNTNERGGARVCTDRECGELAPMSAKEFAGDVAGGTPLPAYVYLPKDAAKDMQLSIVVESSHEDRVEERSFTELPVVRTSEFRTGKMQFIGVRMDPEFRQSIRMYGLDGSSFAVVMMRVYSLESGELLHECEHLLMPIGETDAQGRDTRPSFSMECDMSEHVAANGQKVRIELEPITEGLRYWALMSMTNNRTQSFYIMTPR
jgi:hypothetical protein